MGRRGARVVQASLTVVAGTPVLRDVSGSGHASKHRFSLTTGLNPTVARPHTPPNLTRGRNRNSSKPPVQLPTISSATVRTRGSSAPARIAWVAAFRRTPHFAPGAPLRSSLPSRPDNHQSSRRQARTRPAAEQRATGQLGTGPPVRQRTLARTARYAGSTPALPGTEIAQTPAGAGTNAAARARTH